MPRFCVDGVHYPLYLVLDILGVPCQPGLVRCFWNASAVETAAAAAMFVYLYSLTLCVSLSF